MPRRHHQPRLHPVCARFVPRDRAREGEGDRKTDRSALARRMQGEQTACGPMAVNQSAVIDGPFKSVLAQSMPDGSVRCGVCAHRCLVRDGRRGICGVRENRAGSLVSLVYGQIAATAIDPIEKKPLFHAYPGSTAYSIATPGCPFHCRFCQNWEIAQGPRLGVDIACRSMSPHKVVAEAVHCRAHSIAYTYVEPTVFLEFALDTARLARSAGLSNLFITDGYATAPAAALLGEVIDAANVDLKAFDDRFYRRLCGGRLKPVLDTICALRAAGVWLELTTLVIPGYNDSSAELRELTTWIRDEVGPETPWHVSRFFPAHQMVDLPPTPLASLLGAAEIGLSAGLKHVYIGNAPQLHFENTLCAGCGTLLIERSGYSPRSLLTDAGACPRCAKPLAGIGLTRA